MARIWPWSSNPDATSMKRVLSSRSTSFGATKRMLCPLPSMRMRMLILAQRQERSRINRQAEVRPARVDVVQVKQTRRHVFGEARVVDGHDDSMPMR
eukprot:1314278-Rhodomonas_salina.4